MTALLGEVLAGFLAAVLVAAGLHKLVSRQRLAVASANLLGVGIRAGRVSSLVAALVELCLAGALLSGKLPVAAPALIAALWTAYGLLLVRRGGGMDCGCTFGKRARDAGSGAERAFVLAGLACVSLLLPAGAVTLVSAVGGVAFFSFYLATNELLAAAPFRTRSLA